MVECDKMEVTCNQPGELSLQNIYLGKILYRNFK